MNKRHWNFNRNSNIFIHENALEDIVGKMASICLGLNMLMNIDIKRIVEDVLKQMGDLKLFAQSR